MNPQVCAVVVAYHPDELRFALLLHRLETEVQRIVVVDNTGHNRGLAAAQNRGIALARAAGATHVLLLDQDSVPLPGMTARLLRGLEALQARGVKVACVGPRLRCYGSLTRARDECDALIASGSLLPMAVLDEVGGMEEALFIDQVDTEWCLRARRRGYRAFGVRDAVLDHRPGESLRWIWLGRWRRLIRHPPFRYYTIFRNTLVLCRRDYALPRFVLFQLCWLATLFVAFGLFGGRTGSLPMMLRGIAHGLAGRTGESAAVSCKNPGSAPRANTTSPSWRLSPCRRRSCEAPSSWVHSRSSLRSGPAGRAAHPATWDGPSPATSGSSRTERARTGPGG